jgi:hypothetical protein
MIHDTPPYGHAPIPNIIDLSQKKQLFDPKVKGQGPIKVIMVCDTPPYGHAPTYQTSLTYLERNNYLTCRWEVKVQTNVIMVRDTPLMLMHPHTKYQWPISKDKKCYGPNKKILFKKKKFDLQVKGQGPTKVIMVCNTPPYGHAPTYQISLTYFERQKSYGPDKLQRKKKIRLKQYISPIVRRGDIIKIHI